jgi:protein-S-isoprenylcysteine O-methyltransferase Ste14
LATAQLRLSLKDLVGSGDRIALFTLPFLVVGVGLNAAFPKLFEVGGPPPALEVISIVVLAIGVVLWLWSVALILTRVPRGELITTGPYALVKHPIYTSVALLVLPWLGLLFNTWLGAVIGLALYAGSRLFAPAEEQQLAHRFGDLWSRYAARVAIRWL